jgi:hypothetical protein
MMDKDKIFKDEAMGELVLNLQVLSSLLFD